jgi:hypothetical protein
MELTPNFYGAHLLPQWTFPVHYHRVLLLITNVGNPAQGGLSQLFQNLSYSTTAIETVDFKSTDNTDYGDNSGVGKLLDLSVSIKKLNLWKTIQISPKQFSQRWANPISKNWTWLKPALRT